MGRISAIAIGLNSPQNEPPIPETRIHIESPCPGPYRLPKLECLRANMTKPTTPGPAASAKKSAPKKAPAALKSAIPWQRRSFSHRFLLALALSFGFDYASSIRTWLTSRGEIHGMILGAGPPPEAVGAWIGLGTSLAVWIGLMIGGGIVWKRVREAKTPRATLPSAETSKIFLWLFLDSIVIGCVSFAILYADLNQRREWSSPEKVLARSEGVLQDKDASAGDRALALSNIETRRNQAGSLEILRRAVREETGETRMFAAARHLDAMFQASTVVSDTRNQWCLFAVTPFR